MHLVSSFRLPASRVRQCSRAAEPVKPACRCRVQGFVRPCEGLGVPAGFDRIRSAAGALRVEAGGGKTGRVAVVLGAAVGLVGAGETSGVFVQPVLTAAQQGGSMLATGFVAWVIFQIMAENEPSFAAALDAKVVVAAGGAAGWFLLTGTWVFALLLVILFTGHRLFQASGRGLVNLNGILVVSTEVFLLLNWFFAFIH